MSDTAGWIYKNNKIYFFTAESMRCITANHTTSVPMHSNLLRYPKINISFEYQTHLNGVVPVHVVVTELPDKQSPRFVNINFWQIQIHCFKDKLCIFPMFPNREDFRCTYAYSKTLISRYLALSYLDKNSRIIFTTSSGFSSNIKCPQSSIFISLRSDAACGNDIANISYPLPPIPSTGIVNGEYVL